MNYKLLLGEKIRLERKKKGLTIEELANEADISPNFLGKLERAQSTMSLETLIKIANALQIGLDDLIGYETDHVSSSRFQKIGQRIQDIPESKQRECIELVDLVIDYFLQK